MRRAQFSFTKWFTTTLTGILLFAGQSVWAQDDMNATVVSSDSMDTPMKVAVVIQDSSGMRWDAAFFADETAPAAEQLAFMDGDSSDCDELDCYLDAAKAADANLFLLINTYADQVVLYDPATGDKLGESSLSNPFAVFSAALGGEMTSMEADSTNMYAYGTSDSTMVDSVGAAMDSLAAEALAAAQAASDNQTMESAPELPVSEPASFTAFDKVLYRHLRNFGAFVENPSNLALRHETGTAWSIILPMPFIPLQFRMNNSALTPGWVKDWFQGQFLTETDKQQMTSVLRGKTLDIHTLVDLPTILGFRIGPVGFNAGAHVAINGVLPGDLLMLPWSNFTGDNPLTNLDLKFETLDYVQGNIGYGREIPTPIGNVRAGAGIGLFMGFGYANVESEQFTLATSTDSVVVDLAARGFYTDPNIGLLSDPNTGNMDFTNFPSSIGLGINLGAGLDLYKLTGQHLNVQFALNNIGASLNWSNVTEKTFSAHAVIYDVAAVMDSTSNNDTYIDSLLNPTETVVGVSSKSVTIPMQIALAAQYQPIKQILLQASYRQYFSDGAAWTTDPQMGLYLGIFPFPALEFRGAMNAFMGQTTWSGGFGLHFKRYELGFDFTAINGFGLDASGLGIRMTQSLYF